MASGEATSVRLPLRAVKKGINVWPLYGTNEAPAPAIPACEVDNRINCCLSYKEEDDRHLVSPDLMRDIVIGLADGLTVPFALTAGLSSLGSSRLVVIGGLAELISGAISMGVGGFLASKAERDHALYLYRKVHKRIQHSCDAQLQREVHEILGALGIDKATSMTVMSRLLALEKGHAQAAEVDGPSRRRHFLHNDEKEGEDGELTTFLLKMGEGIEKIPRRRLFISAGVIGLSYFIGGLIPMIPYFAVSNAHQALHWSILATGIILLIFGVAKAYLTGQRMGLRFYIWSALSTLAVGGAAAAASYGIVHALDSGYTLQQQ